MSVESPQPASDAAAVVLRDPLPGDLGWIISRQAALYAREYQFDQRFKGFLASVVAEFVANFDPTGECCWVAECGGAIIASIVLVRKSATIARLRMLYVEPSAPGIGLGPELIGQTWEVRL